MREDQFIKLSQAGENVQIEYKTCYEQISDSLYETVCSFLNHSGATFWWESRIMVRLPE